MSFVFFNALIYDNNLTLKLQAIIKIKIKKYFLPLIDTYMGMKKLNKRKSLLQVL